MKTRTFLITETNMERLEWLMEQLGGGRYAEHVERLERTLDSAVVVPAHEIPQDTITMDSRVLIRDEETGVRRDLTLAWPNEASADTCRVSILSPLGTALLGLRVGDGAEYELGLGRFKRFRVLEILHQPEAPLRPMPPNAA